MQRCIFLVTLFLMSFTSFGLAETQIITLKDGSQIKGELVSINGGSYTVHSPTLGDIKVEASQVANISNPSVAPIQAVQAPTNATSNSNTELNQRIQSAQTKLMSDPQMMAQLQNMMEDPELMKLLSDPTLTQAVMSHDVKAIENNPKAKELMNNPKMHSLMEQLKEKQ